MWPLELGHLLGDARDDSTHAIWSIKSVESRSGKLMFLGDSSSARHALLSEVSVELELPQRGRGDYCIGGPQPAAVEGGSARAADISRRGAQVIRRAADVAAGQSSGRPPTLHDVHRSLTDVSRSTARRGGERA